MISDPSKLIGKRIAYKTMSSIAHGTVTAVSGRPDVVYAENGWGKSKTVSKVSVVDIIKVYDANS